MLGLKLDFLMRVLFSFIMIGVWMQKLERLWGLIKSRKQSGGPNH